MSNFGFNLSWEVDLSKSINKKMFIKGFASTPDKDFDNEEILQKGLDLEYFQEHGWYNYDHNSQIILGFPTVAEIREHGFYTEGELLETPTGVQLFHASVALQKSGTRRRLGMSAEGKILEQDGFKVIRARVHNVALTPHPTNPRSTFEVFAKSLTNDSNEDLIKTLAAGYPSVSADSGSPVMKESLVGDAKHLPEGIRSWIGALLSKTTKSDADVIMLIQMVTGVSRKSAKSVLDKVKNKA